MRCSEAQMCHSNGSHVPKRKFVDWISNPDAVDLTPFQRFTVNVDWTKSALGPMTGWSSQLRSMVLLVVADPSPAVVFWGDEQTAVYNEAYTQLLGDKHPALQGQDPKLGFPEVWDYFGPLIEKQKETGITVVEDNSLLIVLRHGFYEETYFTWKFVPVVCEEGYIIASHETIVETTQQVISERRISVVRALISGISNVGTVREFWTHMIRTLEAAEKDAPLCLLYSASRLPENTTSSVTTTTSRSLSVHAVLEGLIGLPTGHPLVPATLDVTSNNNWLSRLFTKAMNEMGQILVPFNDELRDLVKGIKWRGYGEPTHLVVCPLIDPISKSLLGFLVMGLNPRRPYDERYRAWVEILIQQVTIPQISALMLEQNADRRKVPTAQEAVDIASLLRELSESESRFAKVAMRVPIGLAMFTADGLVISANDLCRSYTRLEPGCDKVAWATVLCPGEYEIVNESWERVLSEKKPMHFQTKTSIPWKAPELTADGKEQWTDTYLLVAIHPNFDDQGNVTTITSCLTNISEIKWSKSQLRTKMEQAIEMKKQQERFIDMTSHEMRNPLSALIGCADEILASLHEYQESLNTYQPLDDESGKALDLPKPQLIQEAIGAADTIIYCAMHQKRIIDDILTLSRLDSNLLVVSPEAAHPVQLVRSALKMFDSELKRASTQLTFIEHDSLQKLNVQWTLLDPSRVLQVLINLMTNAIKFTRTESLRNITVRMSASLTPPSASTSSVEFVPRRPDSVDQTMQAEWGSGEILYLSISVTDSGRGLSREEKTNLFLLFSQASPKTHVQYGGSGLGLFISRMLTEMQGGEIGVQSERGRGSTFQFYVKTRRVEAGAIEEEEAEKEETQMLVRDDALREACGVEEGVDWEGEKEMEHLVSRIRKLSVGEEVREVQEVQKTVHILVVEDNLVNQKVVSKQLRKQGFQVSVANHGGEALDFLMGTDFWVRDEDGERDERDGKENGFHANGTSESRSGLDIILMDLEMPIMDGITCVKRIRELEAEGKIKGHVPVIAVTANARKGTDISFRPGITANHITRLIDKLIDQIMKTMNAGMDDVTTKPYRIQDMLKQIERLVAKHSRPI